MKKIIIIFTAALLGLGEAAAQNSIETILSQVECNNTTLRSLRDEYEAQKLINKTGIYLSDPEIEFAYLWGSPKGTPNRKDFSAKQSFDLAVFLGKRDKVANGQNELIDLQYKQERINLLLETKKTLIELVYTNAMQKECEVRYQQAQQLAEAYRKRFEKGDVNLLESNKIELNLAAVKGELQRLDIERTSLLKNLQRLNGGQWIDFEETLYQISWEAMDFEEWYTIAETKNPILSYVQSEIELGKEQIALTKAQSLPSISMGYTSELITGQNYQGATIGMSIPLWNNKNRVKQAKVSLHASESRMIDAKQQFYSQLAIQYERTQGLQQTASEFRISLTRLSNSSLLQKAMDSGEISLLDYLVEIGLYYNHINQTLAAERDFQISLAELQAVEL